MNIDGIKINYLDYGNTDGETLVFLHGWGQNIEMMQCLAKPLSINNRVIVIDLPGHGISEEPDYVLTIPDFASLINKLLVQLKVDNPIMIGHSFGGKISLQYATKYKTKKLILFASPFKKVITKKSLKVKILKFLKKVPVINKLEGFAKKRIGSTDYKNASEMMRKIMVEHVNLDISSELYKIKAPTLIVWGTNDAAVAIEDAYELEKLIDNAGVVIYEGCTHYAYLERLNQTISVINSFIGGK